MSLDLPYGSGQNKVFFVKIGRVNLCELDSNDQKIFHRFQTPKARFFWDLMLLDLAYDSI